MSVGHHLEESFLDGPYWHPKRCFMCLNKFVKIAKRFILKDLPDLLKTSRLKLFNHRLIDIYKTQS